MSQYNVEVVSKQEFLLGEGPHWCDQTSKLYFVDLLSNFAGLLDLESQQFETIFKSQSSPVSAVLPFEDDSSKVLVSTENALFEVNIHSGEEKKIDEIDVKEVRFNDAKCDSKGRLWVGTMGLETSPGIVVPEAGSLYKLDSNGKLKKMLDKVSLSNGMCWSHDDRTMFYIDSSKRLIYAFDYDSKNATIDNGRILTDMNIGDSFQKQELPDGMTIDKQGNLWVAMFNGSRIVCIDSKSGALLDEIKMPTNLITSVCFGGPKLNEMYATSCKKFLSEDQKNSQPHAGKIFRITARNNPEFCGLKTNFNFSKIL